VSTEGYTIEPAPLDSIVSIWRDRWGIPVMSLERSYAPSDVEGLALRGPGGALVGLVTWAQEGEAAELVTLDALMSNLGFGSRLLREAEQQLCAQGARRLWMITSNDNLKAFSFYVRRGFRLVRVHLDAMDRVRRQKPDTPDVSIDGVPLRDLWELEKPLQA